MTQYQLLDYIKLLEPYLPAFALLGILFLLLFKFFTRKKAVKKNVPGQLRTTTEDKACGIIFGRHKGKVVFSPIGNEGHSLVIGGSGSGKTRYLLTPSLHSFHNCNSENKVSGNSFVIDVSGDLFTIDMPRKLVYAPGSPDSAPYDVFATIDAMQCENERLEALEELALLLMPNKPGAADAARFFNTEGRKILTAALIAFYPELDFIEICEKFKKTSCNDLLLDIQDTGNEAALQHISSFRGQSTSQNTLGCKQAADAAISLFATNEVIKPSIRRPKPGEIAFSPAALETHNCFVAISDTKLELYERLMGLCVSQVLQYLSRRPLENKTPILVALDEFSAFGYLEGITGFLERSRKRHARVIILSQGIANIERCYDSTTINAMLSNLRFKVCMKADDLQTQQLFAELVGYASTKKVSHTHGKSDSTTISESREYVIEPSSLGRLGNELLLIHPEGHVFLEKNIPPEDRHKK